MCSLQPRMSRLCKRTMLSLLEGIWEEGLKSPLPALYCVKWVSLPNYHLPICENVGYLFQRDVLQVCLWNLETVWDKIQWMQCYPLHMSDNRPFFFPVELKLLGRTVVLGILCGLKAWLLNSLFFWSYFKFFFNNAFFDSFDGILFCSWAACAEARIFVHGFAWCWVTQPSYEQDLGDKAYSI